MPEQEVLNKKRNTRKSALLKVFSWLFLSRGKRAENPQDERLEKDVKDYIAELEAAKSQKKEKESKKTSKEQLSPKEILETQNDKKRHKFRDRLQLAAAETRALITNTSGTAEITAEQAFDMKEKLVSDFELTTRRRFSESLGKYIAKTEQDKLPKAAPEGQSETAKIEEPVSKEISDEIRKAETAVMFRKIIKGETHFGIRREIEMGVAGGKENKKLIVNLDAEGEINVLSEMENARLSEIDKVIDKTENIDQSQKDELKKQAKEKVQKEFSVLKNLQKLRNSRNLSENEIEDNVKKLVQESEEIVSTNEAQKKTAASDVAYTSIESVIDPETLDPKERRSVNLSTIEELQKSGNPVVKEAAAGKKEEIYKKTETKQRPVHTLLLEQMVDGFVERHTEARKFFVDSDGKHLSEKLLEQISDDSNASEEEIKQTEQALLQKEEELKSIVNSALTESGISTGESASLTSNDRLIHVPGGVAIIVNDAERFVDLTGMSKDQEVRANMAKNIRSRGAAGVHLKGKTADLIKGNLEHPGYAGDVIIMYSEGSVTPDGKSRFTNRWDQLIDEESTKSLLVHEIDHILQKRQLEGLSNGAERILESLPENEKNDPNIIEKIFKDIHENGQSSKYLKTREGEIITEIANDPLISSLASKAISENEAISAYFDSIGLDPEIAANSDAIFTRKVLRESLFEFSSVLSEPSTNLFDPVLSRIYVKPNENGEIPSEHRALYKFVLTAHKALANIRESSTDMITLRREIIGLIQTSYHKGIDYLNDNLVGILKNTILSEDEINKIQSDVDLADVTKIYGTNEQISLIPQSNQNADFSVFPMGRGMGEYTGTYPPNANEAIDMVDAMGNSIFGWGYARERSRQFEKQAREYEKEGNFEAARYIRLRKPENRGGEEVSPDSTLLMSIFEHFPVIGGFFMPGKIEWAKASLGKRAGHPLYGRTAGRIPIVGQIISKHFPVLMEKGFLKTEEAYSFDSNKLVSADKNIESILQGLQVGFGSIGLDRQEMNAVIASLPLFKIYQPTPAMEPQVEYSQSELGKADKQIWADRSNWAINFKNEIIYGDAVHDASGNIEAQIDAEINDIKANLNEAKRKNRFSKETLDLMKRLEKKESIKNSLLNPDAKGEIGNMRKIYDLLERQANVPEGERFTMLHLVEFARKSHEGKFWKLNAQPGEESHYFKVQVPDGSGGFASIPLSDVNLFIKRYTKAYVKEMFETSQDPSNNHNPIEILDYNARLAREQLPIINSNIQELEGMIGGNAIPSGEEAKYNLELARLKGQKDGLEAQLKAGRQEYKFTKDADFGYEKGTFFDIAWGEADSMLDNHKSGMKFYADYRFRVTQAGMIERRTFNTATFYTRLDRVLDNLGHTAVIAGLALAFYTGAPIAITLVLVGAGLLLADVAFVSKYQQIWMARRIKALEAQEKLDNMISLYEKAASGKMLMPDELDMLTRQKERITFIVESTMKVDPREVVKFPANKPLFAIVGTALALFDEYGANILAGKI